MYSYTTPEDPSVFHTKLLFKDNYAIAVNSLHRLFEREVVSWEELKSEPIATFENSSSTFQDIKQAFRSINTHFSPKAQVKYRNTLMGLVRHQGMITILPMLAIQENTQPNVRAVPIFDPVVVRSYYLVARKDRALNADVRAFSGFLWDNLADGEI